MAFNFPDAPTLNQRWPDPAIAGQPQYMWNGTEWVAANLDPAGYVLRSGDTMTGALSLSGDPTQALHAVPKQYLDAQRQRISLAGLTSVDIQVPASAVIARMVAVFFSTSQQPKLQVSLVNGVFRTAGADYSLHGYYHDTVVAPAAVTAWSGVTSIGGMLVAAGHTNVALPAVSTGTVLLKRPSASQYFTGEFYAAGSTAGIQTISAYTYVAPAAGNELSILALRLTGATAPWTAESYLIVEWL